MGRLWNGGLDQGRLARAPLLHRIGRVADKEGYEIWEYGERPNVYFSDYAGTLDDAVEAMDTAGVSKAVVVNLFMGRLVREAAIAKLPDSPSGTEREKAVTDIETGAETA